MVNRGKMLIFLGFSIIPISVTYFLRKMYSKIDSATSLDKKSVVIFRNYNDGKCKIHIRNRTICTDVCSYYYLQKLVEHINNAKDTISFCICLLTLFELHKALINASNRGVKVRFISDREMIQMSSANVQLLKANGINVKIQPELNVLLHHKFCLIDEYTTNPFMWNGTLNLTNQGLAGNWDLLIFTTDVEKILSFREEFEHLWNSFVELSTV